MARYKIDMTVDGARLESIKKILQAAFKKNGEEIPIHTVEKVTTPESRADRLADASSQRDDLAALVEELKDEMEQWYESIPDNLKEGDKANEVQEAKDALESLQGEIEDLDFDSVSFPGMF